MYDDVDLVCSMEEMGFCDLEKGTDASKADDEAWMMWGFASTPSRDAEEEQLIQKGLNCDPFLSGGWVNWDHDRRQLIGYPTSAVLKAHPKSGRNGLYVEYKLLKALPMAQQVRRIAKALKDEDAPRTLGLSVEGKRRAVGKGGVILKADILGLAVTPYPVNNETSTTILMKGLFAPATEGLPTFEDFTPPQLLALAKAVATGHDVGGTTQTGAGASRKEAIDSRVGRMMEYDPVAFSEYMNRLPVRFRKAYSELEELAKRRDGRVTKGEAIAMFSLLGFSLDAALDAVGLVE